MSRCRHRSHRLGTRPSLGHGLIAFGLLLSVICAAGCTRAPTHVSLREVPTPTGGTPLTLASNQEGVLAAPTGNGLYIRPTQAGSAQWNRVAVPWPSDVEQPSQSPTESLEVSLSGLGFTGDQRFTAYANRFWLIARPGPDRTPRLLVSDTSGRNWRAAPLPPMYRQGERLEDPPDSTPVRHLRLLTYGDDGLYVVDQQRVWRWNDDLRPNTAGEGSLDAGVTGRSSPDSAVPPDAGNKPDSSKSWVRLDILDLRRSVSSHDLPPAIRHYVPRSDKRPFELLTVFSDQLYVYRRWRNAERWLLISTLPTADRQIRTLTDGSIAMLSGNRIRRSMNEGERWETLDIRAPTDTDSAPKAGDGSRRPNASEVTTFAVSGADGTPNQAAIMYAGTADGAIYQTERRGLTWRQVRAPGRDRRRITSIIQHDETTWAGIAGPGILRSDETGTNWQTASRGFRASQPLDVGIGANGELLIATRAGLFRLTGRPHEANYEPIHSRATSAVEVSPKGDWVVSGTFSGDIVVQTPEGRLRTFETEDAPAKGVQVRPYRATGHNLPNRAIVEFAGRLGGDPFYAVPGRGPLWRTNQQPLDWSAVSIPRALRSTLQHTVIHQLLADSDQPEGENRLYMISRGLRQSDRQRLWSSVGGSRWRSIASFDPEPPPGRRLFRLSTSSILYAASSRRLRASGDGGQQWRTVAGPFEQQFPLMAYDVSQGRHMLLHRAPHTTLLRILNGPQPQNDSSATVERIPDERQLELSWRQSDTLPVSPISGVATFDSSLYLTTGRTVFFGSIPPERVQIPHGPTIAITVLLLVVVASLSFLFLYDLSDRSD